MTTTKREIMIPRQKKKEFRTKMHSIDITSQITAHSKKKITKENDTV